MGVDADSYRSLARAEADSGRERGLDGVFDARHVVEGARDVGSRVVVADVTAEFAEGVAVALDALLVRRRVAAREVGEVVRLGVELGLDLRVPDEHLRRAKALGCTPELLVTGVAHTRWFSGRA